MSIIRSHRKRNNFVMIDNSPLMDESLSWKARGILAFLMTKPDGWEISIKNLTKASDKDGRDSLYNGINELMNAGYVVRYQTRGQHQQFSGWNYLIFETLEDRLQWESDNPELAIAAAAIAPKIKAESAISESVSAESGKPEYGKGGHIVINDRSNSGIGVITNKPVITNICSRIETANQSTESDAICAPNVAHSLPDRPIQQIDSEPPLLDNSKAIEPNQEPPSPQFRAAPLPPSSTVAIDLDDGGSDRIDLDSRQKSAARQVKGVACGTTKVEVVDTPSRGKKRASRKKDDGWRLSPAIRQRLNEVWNAEKPEKYAPIGLDESGQVIGMESRTLKALLQSTLDSEGLDGNKPEQLEQGVLKTIEIIALGLRWANKDPFFARQQWSLNQVLKGDKLIDFYGKAIAFRANQYVPPAGLVNDIQEAEYQAIVNPIEELQRQQQFERERVQQALKQELAEWNAFTMETWNAPTRTGDLAARKSDPRMVQLFEQWKAPNTNTDRQL